MKFQNNTDENIKYRLGTLLTGYIWKTVRPTEIVDIPYDLGKVHPLTVVNEETGETNETSTDDQQIVQEEIYINPEYKKRLIDINGIGKKTAEQIIEKYPTEEDLTEAILSGEEVHNRDDVEASLKVEFL